MGSRSERKQQKKAEARKESLRNAAVTGAVALVLLALGVFGFVNNYSRYHAYTDSGDHRTVDAEVTRVDVHSRKNETGRKEFYWDAEVSFEVEGTVYTGKEEFSSEVRPGDVRKVDVYRAKDGAYKIPEVTSETGYTLWNILCIGVAVVGLFLAAAAVFIALTEKEPDRKSAKN